MSTTTMTVKVVVEMEVEVEYTIHEVPYGLNCSPRVSIDSITGPSGEAIDKGQIMGGHVLLGELKSKILNQSGVLL